jgi:hypothetical protein
MIFNRFPNNYTEFSNIAKKFKRKAGIPYAIGAIDGSHIPIKAPKEYPMDYYNRKGFYSIVLQAVVDSYGRFIDIFCWLSWLNS